MQESGVHGGQKIILLLTTILDDKHYTLKYDYAGQFGLRET